MNIRFTVTKHFCHCCKRSFNKEIKSEEQVFVLKDETLFNHMDWETYVKYEEDYEEIVRGFLYDTIEYFTSNSYDRLSVNNDDVLEVMKYIKSKLGECA